MKLRHICEVCGKEEILTPEEAYDKGWDYPPKIGVFGVISPRTCGDCTINQTLWWKMTFEGVTAEDLAGKYKETLTRILSEPKSILVDEEKDI